MEFANKVALVTGAVGSIGKGIAARLLREGAKVFITDLKQNQVEAVCAELGPNCRGLAGDVTVAEHVQRVVQAGQQASGDRIDVLINVAGTVGEGGNVEHLSASNWDVVFAINCKGTFLFTKEVVPAMKRMVCGAARTFLESGLTPKQLSRVMRFRRAFRARASLLWEAHDALAISDNPARNHGASPHRANTSLRAPNISTPSPPIRSRSSLL